MKFMPIGGQLGRLRQPQKGDAVGLILGLKSFLRSPKSSTGFSFRQKKGVLYSLLMLIGSITVRTIDGLVLLAHDNSRKFSHEISSFEAW